MFNEIGKFVARYGITVLLHFLHTFRGFEKGNICANFMKNIGSIYGFFETMRGSGVSSCHNQNIGAFISCINSGLNTKEGFFSFYNGFSFSVAATFGGCLIFQHNASKTSLRVPLYCAFYVNCVTKSCVAIPPNGN